MQRFVCRKITFPFVWISSLLKGSSHTNKIHLKFSQKFNKFSRNNNKFKALTNLINLDWSSTNSFTMHGYSIPHLLITYRITILFHYLFLYSSYYQNASYIYLICRLQILSPPTYSLFKTHVYRQAQFLIYFNKHAQEP